MVNLILYLLTVIIWGTTWLAIKLHLGEVSPEVSIFYRFAISAFLLLIFCKIRKLNLRYGRKEHLFLFLMGFSMFSIHYIFVYKANLYLVSGLVSVIFSWVSVFNIMNSFFFFKKKPEAAVVLGALLGLVGIFVFFWKEMMSLSFFQSKTGIGIGLAFLGSFLFSLSNVISKKIQREKSELVPTTAIAMTYGSLIMFLYVLIRGFPFILPHNLTYWLALSYLIIPGSLVAFLCYLSLISRIGPERAGYATVFFPVIALLLSIFYENHHLSGTDYLGVGFILAGNYLVILKKKPSLSLNKESK